MNCRSFTNIRSFKLPLSPVHTGGYRSPKTATGRQCGQGLSKQVWSSQDLSLGLKTSRGPMLTCCSSYGCWKLRFVVLVWVTGMPAFTVYATYYPVATDPETAVDLNP